MLIINITLSGKGEEICVVRCSTVSSMCLYSNPQSKAGSFLLFEGPRELLAPRSVLPHCANDGILCSYIWLNKQCYLRMCYFYSYSEGTDVWRTQRQRSSEPGKVGILLYTKKNFLEAFWYLIDNSRFAWSIFKKKICSCKINPQATRF